MGKYKWRNTIVKILAYIHRYIAPLLIVIPLPLAKTKNSALLWMGICSVLFALYTLLGYILHWKHIYCSYQNAYYQKMTPDYINWNKVKKTDAFGVPLFFGILGIVSILTATVFS